MKILKSEFYNPKYEKNKIVKILNVSNNYIWFGYDNKRFKYPRERFERDFVITLDKM